MNQANLISFPERRVQRAQYSVYRPPVDPMDVQDVAFATVNANLRALFAAAQHEQNLLVGGQRRG